MWALTSDQVKLYQLPASDEITRQVHIFKDAVRSSAPAGLAAVNLSRSLFSQLPPAMAEKRNWLIAADGALLDGVPFAALPELIAGHTLRMLPSEALLDSPHQQLTRPLFVGVADPIYNLADTRRPAGLAMLPVSRQSDSFSLGRLVASDREVRSAAAAVGLPAVEILTGEAASGRRIAQAVSERPQVLHFAVHVVTPESNGSEAKNDPEQAALALTLTSDNMPELLTRESIAALRLPGSLVVLSGCSSQQGAVLRSAGLVGLSRAWLLAGASAVLVTNWPTPDDSGAFFRVFYEHFHDTAGTLAQRAAAALQQTQSEMKAGSGYRSNAAFWSAYSLISKE